MYLVILLLGLLTIPNFALSSTYYCIDTSARVYPCVSDVAKAFASNDAAVAHVRFVNRINQTGWAELDLETASHHSSETQAYYAGLLEGYLTSHLIDSFRHNTGIGQQKEHSSELCQKLSSIISDNLNATIGHVNHDNDNRYWKQVGLSLYQLAGIDDGYDLSKGHLSSKVVHKPHLNVDPCGSIMINLIAELGDLIKIKNSTTNMPQGDHCSALVKWVPEHGEVYVSHNTWTDYSMMLRVLKKYTLNFDTSEAESVAMSSYPGLIFSVDDFYITSQHMVIQETSIANYNDKLWKGINVRNFVFEFIRNTVSNRLARSGEDWVHWFGLHNGGTYNNQFMVIDYKRMKRHDKQLEDGFLHVLEQLPTMIVWQDMTEYLRKHTYWPSYNVPYFKKIYQESGFDQMYAKYGDFFSYNKTARAAIFSRDHLKVTNVTTMYRMMRFNDFKNDPLSRCANCSPQPNGVYAIAARGDLNDPNGKYPVPILRENLLGAIDAKITSARLAKKLEMVAVSGPTDVNEPAFDWTRVNKKDKAAPHVDQPTVWNFKPIITKWDRAGEQGFDNFEFEL